MIIPNDSFAYYSLKNTYQIVLRDREKEKEKLNSLKEELKLCSFFQWRRREKLKYEIEIQEAIVTYMDGMVTGCDMVCSPVEKYLESE